MFSMFSRQFADRLTDRIVAKVLHALGSGDLLDRPDCELVAGLKAAVRRALAEAR